MIIPQIFTANAQSDNAEVISSQTVQKLSENNTKDNHTTVETKEDAKITSENKKISTKSSFPNANGIKNIVDHPFRIIGRGFGWCLIGGLLGIFTFGYPVAIVGAVCGIASKIIQLYLEGCNQ